MTQLFVLDASVAVKWFYRSEIGHQEAAEILRKIGDQPEMVIVPDLFFIEMAAVLVRKSKWTKSFVNNALQTVIDLGFQILPTAGGFLLKASALACEYGISVYDSIYVVTAKEVGGVWLTADKEAARRLPKNLVVTL